MIIGAARSSIAIGAVLLLATTAINPAVAATFAFDTTATTNSLATSKNFASTTVGGVTVNMHVTAWHWNDPSVNSGDGKIASAQLGLWTPGLGVLAANESVSTNEHQIDNVGGVDFLMLQFDRDVSLSGIGRVAYTLPGFTTIDTDASYWADTTKAVGTAAGWATTVDLSKFSMAPSLWADIPGGSTSGTVSVLGTGTAAVWLIGANIRSADRDDGFKLSVVNVTAAVPEPATWAMFIGGFGLIGTAMRRRRAATRLTVGFA